eukprot:NP_001254848.1 Uncharacterized protein CELE_Y39A3CR.8 [Caenorhabditis elegans]
MSCLIFQKKIGIFFENCRKLKSKKSIIHLHRFSKNLKNKLPIYFVSVSKGGDKKKKKDIKKIDKDADKKKVVKSVEKTARMPDKPETGNTASKIEKPLEQSNQTPVVDCKPLEVPNDIAAGNPEKRHKRKKRVTKSKEQRAKSRESKEEERDKAKRRKKLVRRGREVATQEVWDTVDAMKRKNDEIHRRETDLKHFKVRFPIFIPREPSIPPVN